VEDPDCINRVISVEFENSRESSVSRRTRYHMPNLLESGKTRCVPEERPKIYLMPRRYKFDVNLAGSVLDPHTRTWDGMCLTASLRSQGTVRRSSGACAVRRDSVPAAAQITAHDGVPQKAAWGQFSRKARVYICNIARALRSFVVTTAANWPAQALYKERDLCSECSGTYCCAGSV
jgi:hypothetical protein